MEKCDLASYLCNLITIMDAKEDVGLHKGETLVQAYNAGYGQLMSLLKKEQEDEARKRKDDEVEWDKGEHQQSLNLGSSSDRDLRGGKKASIVPGKVGGSRPESRLDDAQDR